MYTLLSKGIVYGGEKKITQVEREKYICSLVWLINERNWMKILIYNTSILNQGESDKNITWKFDFMRKHIDKTIRKKQVVFFFIDKYWYFGQK